MIVITGVSSSGKTTLSKLFEDKYDLKLYSLDDIKVEGYEKYGYLNKIEHSILKNLGRYEMQARIISDLRSNDARLVLEYPFTKEWQNFFDYCREVYKTKLIIINCNTKDFEKIWDMHVNRDSVRFSDERHNSLHAKKYIRDSVYVQDKYILTDKYKEKLKNYYTNNKFCSLTGDFIFNDSEIDKVEELILLENE